MEALYNRHQSTEYNSLQNCYMIQAIKGLELKIQTAFIFFFFKNVLTLEERKNNRTSH